MYNVVVAYILWLLSGFGVLGFHRFYLGKIPTGLLWMFTGGFFALGAIYDLLTLPRQVRDANLQKALLDQIRRQYNSPNVMPNRAGQGNWRYANDGEFRVMGEKTEGKKPEKDRPEQVILKLAKENHGILSISDVALGANIPMEEAQNLLDSLVTKGFAELRVRQSGTLVYAIPDMIDKHVPLESF